MIKIIELFEVYKAVFNVQVHLYHGTVQTWYIVMVFFVSFFFFYFAMFLDCPFCFPLRYCLKIIFFTTYPSRPVDRLSISVTRSLVTVTITKYVQMVLNMNTMAKTSVTLGFSFNHFLLNMSVSNSFRCFLFTNRIKSHQRNKTAIR